MVFVYFAGKWTFCTIFETYTHTKKLLLKILKRVSSEIVCKLLDIKRKLFMDGGLVLSKSVFDLRSLDLHDRDL